MTPGLPAVLSPYRVLDLAHRGMICGQILADLGADVIAVEPPGGSPARSRGPFAGCSPDPERSLNWWAYARNKRGIVLDLDTGAGRDELKRLVAGAHFLIESERPGVMAKRGLDYESLQAINPGLVHVSITAYGQDGPRAQDAATDLTALASGGLLILYGDRDRAPVRVSIPQAFHHAGAEAAVGALLAHHQRLRSGLGQHVDVSAQQAVTLATQSDIISAAIGEQPLERWGGGLVAGPMVIRNVYPARDGHVTITHIFGSAVGPATRRLMEFVHDEGFCDAATRDKDWIRYGRLVARGEEPVSEFERVKEAVAACTASKTKAELFAAAIERRLLLAPITTTRDILESEQFRARGYLVDVERNGNRAVFPGPFAKFGATPIQYRRPAPRIGEHTDEVLGVPARPAEFPEPTGQSDDLPLAGVKVLDFMWAIAGPAAMRLLADYGATVVRVESARHPDVCRTLRPFHGGVPDGEGSLAFHGMNVGKRMMTLNLSVPEARSVVRDLVRWADVVAESFTPRAQKKIGLDYASLREVKPDLIMTSSCLMGQTGPLADFAGYGNLAAGITGFFDLTGWPDRPPAGPYSAYTDYVAPRFVAASILAALEHRRRSGEGQHIDLSQAEASLHFLTPALLDFSANGVVQKRAGNADPHMAPHGVYPALGDDAWVAIAVEGDGQWTAMCDLMGKPALGKDPRFASASARLERRDELDILMSEFTSIRSARDVESLLQQAGIAASAVLRSGESIVDPQLLHRGHFVPVSGPRGHATMVEAARARLSRTPARVEGEVPLLGLHTNDVLTDILGYDDERIAALAIAGALE